jgi:hypothetical protein
MPCDLLALLLQELNVSNIDLGRGKRNKYWFSQNSQI